MPSRMAAKASMQAGAAGRVLPEDRLRLGGLLRSRPCCPSGESGQSAASVWGLLLLVVDHGGCLCGGRQCVGECVVVSVSVEAGSGQAQRPVGVCKNNCGEQQCRKR